MRRVRIRSGLVGLVLALGMPAVASAIPMDMDPPTLVSAQGLLATNEILIMYSEDVEPFSSTDPFAYEVEKVSPAQSLFVASVSPGSDPSKVLLGLDASTPLVAGMEYTVTVYGVLDLAFNEIAPGSMITFRVPEPATLALAACGLPLLAAHARRRRRRS